MASKGAVVGDEDPGPVASHKLMGTHKLMGKSLAFILRVMGSNSN